MTIRARFPLTLCGLAGLLAGCGGHPEFVAQDADLASAASWTQVVMRAGPGPDASAIGMAHDTMDVSITRTVYVNQSVSRGGNGQFPSGTIFAKLHRKDGRIIGGTAMAKRGASFNTADNGWEWFMLKADGTIMGRGDATFMDGMCHMCHGARKGQDFVFVK
jgi:hypothetical protein